MLSDTEGLKLLEELCITQVATINSFAKVLTQPGGSVYIVIHRQTISLYYNSSG